MVAVAKATHSFPGTSVLTRLFIVFSDAYLPLIATLDIRQVRQNELQQPHLISTRQLHCSILSDGRYSIVGSWLVSLLWPNLTHFRLSAIAMSTTDFCRVRLIRQVI